MKTIRFCVLLSCAIITLFGSCSKNVDVEIMRLYVNAREMYSDGNFNGAAALLNGVKDFPPALTLRAKAEYFSGDLDKAEKSCRQAIKHRPGAYEAKLYLARILRDKGDDANARRTAENLLADYPHDARLLRFAASLALEKGDAAEAAVLLDQAAELSADSAMVLLDRARLRWIAGKGEEALEDLSRARAMLPWDTPIARSIHQLENRITEALK